MKFPALPRSRVAWCLILVASSELAFFLPQQAVPLRNHGLLPLLVPAFLGLGLWPGVYDWLGGDAWPPNKYMGEQQGPAALGLLLYWILWSLFIYFAPRQSERNLRWLAAGMLALIVIAGKGCASGRVVLGNWA